MKTFAFLSAIALGTAGIIATAPADAQRYNWNQWRTIGFKTVSGRVDNDRINVDGNTRFTQVRLCVFNAPLAMRDFDIRFENGRKQDVSVRQRIAAGHCTRNIDLVGNRRDIDTIRLRYSPIRSGWTRPLVRVQARVA
jgi:hypothetical protein